MYDLCLSMPALYQCMGPIHSQQHQSTGKSSETGCKMGATGLQNSETGCKMGATGLQKISLCGHHTRTTAVANSGENKPTSTLCTSSTMVSSTSTHPRTTTQHAHDLTYDITIYSSPDNIRYRQKMFFPRTIPEFNSLLPKVTIAPIHGSLRLGSALFQICNV